MKTGIAYYRYSSALQDETSIEAQQDAVHRYATKQGVRIIAEFFDRETSGKTDDRPDFIRSIEMIKSGAMKPDFYFVHKVDRFARNRYDSVMYKHELKKRGIKYVAVDQPFDNTTPEGVLMEGMLETLAEYYSLNLANEVMKGLNNNARKARFNGGFPPLGFKIVDGRYEHDEPAASSMRRVFEMTAQGASHTQCLALLANYRTRIYKTKKGEIKGGRPYTKSALLEMLRNPKYAGIYVYNRAPRRVDGSRNYHQSKDPKEIIVIEDAIPPIVSKEVFNQVQEILDQRRTRYAHPRENRANYVLTGKVVCGDCESPMTGYSKRNKEGKLYRYYYCNNGRRTGKKHSGKKCSNGHWNKSETEKRVAAEIRDELLTYAQDENKIDKCYTELKALDSDRKDLRAPLERDIRNAEERISRLLDLAERGNANLDSIYNRIEENEATLKLLKQELSQIKTDLKYDRESVRQYFLDAVKMANSSNLEDLKQLLEKYVERIILHPTGNISIDFIFRPTSASVYIDGAEGAVIRYTHTYK